MGNIKTCLDTSRQLASGDDKILDEKFGLIDEARKHLIDPETGKFRSIAEAMEITKKEAASK